MSKSITLICPPDLTLPHIYAVLNESWPEKCWYTSGEKPEVQVQSSGNECWYTSFADLTPAQNLRDEYADHEAAPPGLRAGLDAKIFCLVTFNDYHFCAQVIRFLLSKLMASIQSIWLDNDYGVLIPATVVLSEFARNPEWDWRSYHP